MMLSYRLEPAWWMFSMIVDYLVVVVWLHGRPCLAMFSLDDRLKSDDVCAPIDHGSIVVCAWRAQRGETLALNVSFDFFSYLHHPPLRIHPILPQIQLFLLHSIYRRLCLHFGG